MIIPNPSTLYIRFLNEIPKVFQFGTTSGELVYFRNVYGTIPRIKFNVPIPGDYVGNVPFDIVRIAPIEIPVLSLPVLPPANRDRWPENLQFVYNPNLDTVARNWTNDGIVELGPRFYKLTKAQQEFIKLHEQGHFLYSGEEDCDLFALVNFVRMGYNLSTAYYTLQNDLSKSTQQVQRLKSMFDNISHIQKFNP